MGKIINTSNISFATSTCGNAAFYFNPTDVEYIRGLFFKHMKTQIKLKIKFYVDIISL